MQLFLRSLPTSSFFNIISFGYEFSSLWKSSRKYSQQSLTTASKHIAGMTANFGGTRLLNPIKHITATSIPSACSECAVLLLTDGEVTNTSEIIDHVELSSDSPRRFYTIGIGETVSHALVNGIAQAGRGEAEYVCGGDKRGAGSLQAKVVRQLKRVLGGVGRLDVEWRGVGKDVRVTQTPEILDGVTSSDRLSLAGLLPKRRKSDYNTRAVVLHGKECHITVPFDDDDSSVYILEQNSTFLHQLIAGERIAELERKKKGRAQKEATRLSLQYGVPCKWTALVAVEEHMQETKGSMKSVTVPLAVPRYQRKAGLAKASLGGCDRFSSSFISTIGIDFKVAKINLGNGKEIKTQIWDTSGQERFRSITSSYYRGSTGILLVFDVTDKHSFDSLGHWRKQIDRFASRDVVVMLIGNKVDLADKRRAVSYDTASEEAAAHGMSYFETSARTMEGVNEAFAEFYEEIYMKHYENNRPAFILKVQFIGNSGVGKSALTSRTDSGSIDLSAVAERFPLPRSHVSATSRTPTVSLPQNSGYSFCGAIASLMFAPFAWGLSWIWKPAAVPRVPKVKCQEKKVTRSEDNRKTNVGKKKGYGLDVLDKVVQMQQADGKWADAIALCRVLGISKKLIDPKSREDCWATAVAGKVLAQEQQYDLVRGKGVSWLVQQIGQSEATKLDALLTTVI